MHRRRLQAAIMAAALEFACPATAQSPFAFTWGGGTSGELGNGALTPAQLFPTSVLDANGNCCLGQMIDVQAGDTFSLGLDSAHRLWTWGDNSVGELGIGTVGPDSAIPVQVPNLTGRLPAASSTVR